MFSKNCLTAPQQQMLYRRTAAYSDPYVFVYKSAFVELQKLPQLGWFEEEYCYWGEYNGDFNRIAYDDPQDVFGLLSSLPKNTNLDALDDEDLFVYLTQNIEVKDNVHSYQREDGSTVSILKVEPRYWLPPGLDRYSQERCSNNRRNELKRELRNVNYEIVPASKDDIVMMSHFNNLQYYGVTNEVTLDLLEEKYVERLNYLRDWGSVHAFRFYSAMSLIGIAISYSWGPHYVILNSGFPPPGKNLSKAFYWLALDHALEVPGIERVEFLSGSTSWKQNWKMETEFQFAIMVN